jgi:methylated-DNA-[protein]-cysteine S-methyltransferase
MMKIKKEEMINKKIFIRHYPTPAGELILGSCDNKLCLCDWAKETRRSRIDSRIERMLNAKMVEGDSDVINHAIIQLEEYFAHKRTSFDIPLIFAGTDFQKRVWNKLLEIPYGEIMSYGEMARRLGCPTSVRAVANANGANAISIFVPCHRIVGSNHTLGGYGGGLEAKRMLLQIENDSLNSNDSELAKVQSFIRSSSV